jgi:hypothetical protein
MSAMPRLHPNRCVGATDSMCQTRSWRRCRCNVRSARKPTRRAINDYTLELSTERLRPGGSARFAARWALAGCCRLLSWRAHRVCRARWAGTSKGDGAAAYAAVEVVDLLLRVRRLVVVAAGFGLSTHHRQPLFTSCGRATLQQRRSMLFERGCFCADLRAKNRRGRPCEVTGDRSWIATPYFHLPAPRKRGQSSS